METTTCSGFTHQGKPCRNPQTENGYCVRHGYQKDCSELQDVGVLSENQIANVVRRSQNPKKITRPRIKKITPEDGLVNDKTKITPKVITRRLPFLSATPLDKKPMEITDIFQLLAPEHQVNDDFKSAYDALKALGVDYQGKEEIKVSPNEDLFLEYQRRDLDKQREELFAYEDRLVRWDANLRKKEASLKEREVVLNLLMAEDPAPIEQKFEEMAKAIDVFAAMMKRLRGYREDNLAECCVCLDQHLTKDELLSCGHPVCLTCKVNLPKPECPMCRKRLVNGSIMEEPD